MPVYVVHMYIHVYLSHSCFMFLAFRIKVLQVEEHNATVPTNAVSRDWGVQQASSLTVSHTRLPRRLAAAAAAADVDGSDACMRTCVHPRCHIDRKQNTYARNMLQDAIGTRSGCRETRAVELKKMRCVITPPPTTTTLLLLS